MRVSLDAVPGFSFRFVQCDRRAAAGEIEHAADNGVPGFVNCGGFSIQCRALKAPPGFPDGVAWVRQTFRRRLPIAMMNAVTIYEPEASDIEGTA